MQRNFLNWRLKLQNKVYLGIYYPEGMVNTLQQNEYCARTERMNVLQWREKKKRKKKPIQYIIIHYNIKDKNMV